MSRPQLAEARRVRAVELFENGLPSADIATAAGGVWRWRRVWEQGGASARRRRAATGRPPKLDDAQIETVWAALERGTQAHGFEADLRTLELVGAVVTRATGVVLSNASVWRLLTGRHGWSLQRPERWAISGTDRRPPAGSRTSGRAPPVELLWLLLKKRELAGPAIGVGGVLAQRFRRCRRSEVCPRGRVGAAELREQEDA
ncbi:winged helix-turn-helix domain-containing protein [Streptomyces sp. b94]|uniref:winged helix-turn-helix domain-containing protein n=1 Tax=Streptomyces sp. b94 TaxID=1827634 RepID=UPI001B382E13|nr:winged helix-turn-helix domain-containing protein [Streptomyces sp. b94]